MSTAVVTAHVVVRIEYSKAVDDSLSIRPDFVLLVGQNKRHGLAELNLWKPVCQSEDVLSALVGSPEPQVSSIEPRVPLGF